MTKNFDQLKSMIREARRESNPENQQRMINNAMRFSIDHNISNKKLKELLNGGLF